MKKKYKSLVTIFMIFEMFVANLAPVVTLARNDNLKINDPNLKNTVIVTDQSLEDCRRLLEGEAYYTLPLAEKEPVDLVVIQDASGSFEGNFPKLKEAIKELLPEMPSQDRVMLTSYQGGQFYQLANGKVIDNSPGDSPINIRTVTPLTDDKEVFMDGYNSIRPKGTTPTALGLQEALNSYNKAHGDLSKRKTYFLLITDGVANVQLDGKIHKLNNALLEYPAGMFGGTSVEYSSDYKSAAAEVLDLNQQIKSQGYTMINAFWESVNHLSASNSYYDRYKEIGPYVKEELEKGASSPEDFIVGNTIDDFKNQVKELLEQKIHQMPDATSSLLINDKFDIQSVSATDQDGKQLDTKVNGQTIKVVTPGTYTGSVKIKYQLKENAPIDTETIVSSGNLVQGESKVEFPEALIEANEHAHDCDIKPVNPTIEKDVEGKEHLELTNRTDEFEWHINAQFGNETSQWTQAALVDQLNDLLTIKDVKVVDETGKDVSGNGRLTTEKNKVQFTLAKKDGSYSYLSGHTYTMTIKTTISAEATEEALAAYSKENGIPNQADLVFGDEGESIHSEKPTVTPPPVNPTIEKDIEGKEHLELTNRTDEFEWHINAQFGNETSQWTQAALVDQVNDLLTIKDVKVVDETGKDVSGNGRLTTEKNKVQFTLAKKEGSYSYLSGHTYSMTIKTTISAEATEEALAAYSKENGIPNQADLVFGDEGESIHSEKPTVTPPPVNPTIEKDVEGKEHLELTNRTDEFEWHINAQFGNETSQWTQAALVDQLNDLLTIKDVKVVDETGKDVSGNGHLTTEKNKVEFTLAKKDGSYSYLSGHTYTMTIKTTISEEATEEALAAYSKENGIPNQADLVFGDEGESIHSEKPTVTPPPVNPTIEKDIEGKEHLELTNRTDEFDWHINAQFGNETSQWTQAALVDQLNDLLTIKDVKVVDETGKDVSGNGRLTTEKNKVQFTLAKKEGSYSYLSGHTYTMTIKTTISEEATEEALAAYSKENGIPNQADLVFGDEGESIHSEKPTVTPPPVNPTIEKDVEGKEHLELTNRTDEFDWHINAQFGNETSQWTQAALVDQLNDLLTIKDVKVVDETGKDVSGNGRLTTEKNKVQFTLAKKDGSYSYLSGHTYTMTIKTTISEETTEEALAAYSKENGIPNQADLVFGDEGKSIHSEKPTVTPPLNSLDKPKVEKNGLNTNSKRPNKIGMFPNTNSTINYGYIVIGLFLIVIVIFFLFMRINRKK